MHLLAKAFGFLHWVGISHYLNLLLLGFLIRSGLQVLSAHPKLYWNDHCTPGSEWLRLTRKQMPSDTLWTATDEEDPFLSWVALPGGRNLGVGRHWHLFGTVFWVLNGLGYVGLLFVTGEWRRLLPTSAAIFPEAVQTAWTYPLYPRSPALGPLRNKDCRGRSNVPSPSASLMPYWVTMCLARSLARCRSSWAPVETSPKMISSATRPPKEYVQAVHHLCARHQVSVLRRLLLGVAERGNPARDDRDLRHLVAVVPGLRDHGVTRLVVGDDSPSPSG